MAEIWPRYILLDGEVRPIRLVFRSRLVRAMNLIPFVEIGGLTLSASTVRFKRSPAEVPRELVAHELGHVLRAVELGWRYLPTYLVRRHKEEQLADLYGRRLSADTLPRVARPAWLDRFGSAGRWP